MHAVLKKEFRSYFTSIIGWLFIGFALAVIGFYSYMYNFAFGYTTIGIVLSAVTIIFSLIIPILTMRIFAEENRQKTDQLLFTSPVSVEKIVFGKYIAACSVMAIVCAIICVYPIILSAYGTVNFVLDYLVIIMFFLMGAAYIAIGMYISSLTDSQVVAVIITFIVFLVSMLINVAAENVPTSAITAWIVFAVIDAGVICLVDNAMKNKIVTLVYAIISEGILGILYFIFPTVYEGSLTSVANWLSIVVRFDEIVNGDFDITAIFYYFSVIALFVFLTVQTIKKKRWN